MIDPVHPFTVLSDPVRRRMVETLAAGPRTAGELTQGIRDEFAVSQPAVSNQLRVLRDSGFVNVTPQGARRLYELQERPLSEISEWLRRQQRFWERQLDELNAAMASPPAPSTEKRAER